MTLIRWIASLLFILSISIYVLLLTLPVFFTPNDYKAQLIDLVVEKTGRHIEIAGDIQIQISPLLNATCTLGKTRLGGNTLFANSTCIASEQTKIELSLWPLLLQRRLHMATIMLDGVTLNLLHNKEGLNNWQPITTPPAEANGPPSETSGATAPGSPPENTLKKPLLTRFLRRVTGIDLGKLTLSHVNMRYDNRQTDTIIVLKDLLVKTGRLKENIPFPFEVDCNLTLDNHGKKTSMPRSGDITMQGNATLFLQERRLLLEDLRLDATLKGKSLPKRGLVIGLATNSDIQLSQQKITIKDFSLNHDNTALQGNGTWENFTDPQVMMTLKVPECSPQSILKQMKATQPLIRNDTTFSLLSGSLLLKGNRELVEITDLTMKVDETTVTGAITIKDLDNPSTEAAIHINQLDLDRYAGQLPGRTKAANNQETASALPIIPTRFLHDLLLQLDLQLDSLKVGGAALSQVQIRLNGKDGIARLTPFTANAYDGAIKIEAMIDVSGETPRIQFKPRINKIKLGPLFQDTTAKDDIAGAAFLQADLNTSGLSPDDLLEHMNGTLRLEIVNGKLKPFPIRQAIHTALASPQKKPLPEATAPDTTTEFTQLSGTAVIEDGILYNDDLMVTAETMQMNGAMDIDLVHRQTDCRLNVSLPFDPALNPKLKAPESGDTIIVPYTISGPFSSLTQMADVTRLLPPEAEIQPSQEPPIPAETKEPNPGNNRSAPVSERVENEARGD